jgi:hypothetical protein
VNTYTNNLVCHIAAPSANILWSIGQHSLLGPDGPERHPAKHQRIKTVKQELFHRAGRLI